MRRTESAPRLLALAVVGLALALSCVCATAADGGDAVLEKWVFDSNTPPEGWRQLRGKALDTENGWAFRINSGGPIIRYKNLKLEALQAGRFEIELEVVNGSDRTPLIPTGMKLFWARQTDLEPDLSWPFSNSRCLTLERDAARPQCWGANLNTHPNWLGTIREFCTALHLPDDATTNGGADIRVKRVAFGRRATLDKIFAPDRPANVIFVLIDTLRADHLSCMGYERTTSPYLDHLAERGVLFDSAYAQGDGTAFSMPVLYTGKYYSQLFADPPAEGGIPESATSLAQLFRQEGFATRAWSTNPHVSKRTRFDKGYDVFEELYIRGAVYSRIEHVVRQIQTTYVPSDRPEFLYVHLMDVHSPYHPPAPYNGLWKPPYDRDVFQGGRMLGLDGKQAIGMHPYWAERHDVCPIDIEYAVSQYDGEICYMDDHLSELLAAVDYRADKDLLVITADHGEQFYENGFIGHNKSTRTAELHVPLLFCGPGLEPRRITTPVGLIDVLPTLCELFDMPLPEGVSGRSLVPALHGGTLAPRPVFAEAAPSAGIMGTVVSGESLYYLNIRRNEALYPWRVPTVQEALYDLGDDPLCRTDLAAVRDGQADHMNALLRELSPRFAHTARSSVSWARNDIVYSQDIVSPHVFQAPLELSTGSTQSEVSVLLTTPHPGKSHFIELTYTLAQGKIVLSAQTVRKGKGYEYTFHKARLKPRYFSVVIAPAQEQLQLRFSVQGEGASAQLQRLRCRPFDASEIPVETWPDAAAYDGHTRELTDEEIERLKGLGYL